MYFNGFSGLLHAIDIEVDLPGLKYMKVILYVQAFVQLHKRGLKHQELSWRCQISVYPRKMQIIPFEVKHTKCKLVGFQKIFLGCKKMVKENMASACLLAPFLMEGGGCCPQRMWHYIPELPVS